MKLTFDFMEFEGDMLDLVELAKFSKAVRKLLEAEKGYSMAEGKSYTLDSFETWDDPDDDT